MSKKSLKILLLSFVLVSIFSLVVVLGVKAADDEGTVTATVTVQNIALTVTDGGVAYGTLASNTTESTCTSDLDDLQTVTNTGNVTENFDIKGQNSGDWTLAGSAGSDIYVHEFLNATCSTFSGGTALTTSYATLATGISASGTTDLNLQINTPNPSTVYTEQSVDVTVLATAS